jgi:type IX secretion system PorP/SprF family membrane protein
MFLDTTKYLVLIIVFLFAKNQVVAQDIHWSQINNNPIFLNPANAGNFEGDYRLVGNYKDQWRSVTVPFTTFSISADSRIEKIPAIGYGFLFFHDNAGDGFFKTLELQANGSYHLKLDKNERHSLRFGLNIGINNRQVNWDLLHFDNQFNGIVFDPSLATKESNQTNQKTNISIGFGTNYTFKLAERKSINIGLSAFNINQPNQGFYSTVVKRDVRYSIYVNGFYPINLDLDLIPSINASFQGVYSELLFGSAAKYTLEKTVYAYKAIYGGIYLRNKDAFIVHAGMDYQNWFVGLSYDINFSKLVPASNARGGFEIAVKYILNKVKKNNLIHRVCPDYI